MAERTGDRDWPLANMVLRWMAYNQPGLTDKQMDACLAGADALEEVERLREASDDRHAALEVGAAELHDFILSVEWYGTRCHPDITGCQDEDVCPVCDASAIEGHRANCRLARILQTPPPQRGGAILGEVERLREVAQVARNIRHDCCPETRALNQALAALDQTAPREVEGG